MAKIEVEEEHYMAAILSLEHVLKLYLTKKEIYAPMGFGIVMALQNKEDEVKTVLTSFHGNHHKFDIIENGRFPNGKVLIMFTDKGDMVTQAALTGSEIVDNPLEVNK